MMLGTMTPTCTPLRSGTNNIICVFWIYPIVDSLNPTPSRFQTSFIESMLSRYVICIITRRVQTPTPWKTVPAQQVRSDFNNKETDAYIRAKTDRYKRPTLNLFLFFSERIIHKSYTYTCSIQYSTAYRRCDCYGIFVDLEKDDATEKISRLE